jgi:hypothetical protein
MTDTSGFSDYIAPQGPGQERILMTDEQKATKRKIGVPAGTVYVRPDFRPGDTEAFAPDLVSVGPDGVVRTGPYKSAAPVAQTPPPIPVEEEPPIEDQFRKRREEQAEQVTREAEDAVLKQAAEDDAAQAKEKSGGLLQTVGAVAADIGTGIFLEGPGAAIVGAKKGVTEILEGVEEIADQIPYGSITWSGLDGDAATPFKIEAMSGKEAKAKGLDEALSVPDGFDTTKSEAAIKSTTGQFVKSASQFVTGWVTGGKVLKSWKAAGSGAAILKGMAQGAIADFSAFDGQEKRLSNMIKELAPDKQIPIIEYLAADEDDGELFGRVKNAFEGVIVGGAVEAVANGIKLLKRVRKVKAAVRAEAAQAGHTIDPTVSPEDAEIASKKLEAEVEKLLKPTKPKKPTIAAKAKAQMGVVPQDAKGTKALADELLDPGGAEVVARQQDLRTVQKDLAAAKKAAKKPDADPGLAQKIDELTTAEAQAKADLAAAESLNGQVPNVFDINLNIINTPDDVKAMILKLAEKNAKNIDEARRGIQTWANTRQRAAMLDGFRIAAQRRTGQPLNDAETLALEAALIGAAEKTKELAILVKQEPGNVAAQIAIRRATALTHAVLMENRGNSAELARAMNAMKIMNKANPYRGVDLEAMLRDAGGAEGAQELADRILMAERNGGSAADLASGWEHTGAALKMLYTNGLLSGLTSPIVNVIGSTGALIQNLANRAAIEAWPGSTVHEAGEALAILEGYTGALRDMFRLNPKEAFKAITWEGVKADGFIPSLAPGLQNAKPDWMKVARREESGRMGDVGFSSDPKLSRPLSAAAHNVDESNHLGIALDVLQAVIESPSKANVLGDDFFATISARGAYRAGAWRKAMQEGRAGGWTVDQIKARQADLIENPTRDLIEEATREMEQLTFTRQDGKFAQGMQTVRRWADDEAGGKTVPLGTIVLPFLRTPTELASFAIRNSPLAPLSGRWRTAIAAGGAEREMALASFGVGTALWGVYSEMHMNGTLTGQGPKNRAQREALMREDATGNVIWQPNSVKVNGVWFDISRADPVAQNALLAANMMELIHNSDWDSTAMQEVSDMTAYTVGALGQAFLSKSPTKGAVDWLAALTTNDTAKIERMLGVTASSTVPFSSAVRMFRRIDDPIMRDVSSIQAAYANTLPGLSDDLPAQRDIWGREKTYQSGIMNNAMDFISPFKMRAAGGSFIDQAILDNGVSVGMPQKSFSMGGVNVSLKNHPEIYYEYVRLAGEPAFEYLNAVAGFEHPDSAAYDAMSDGPNGEKALFIKGKVELYRRVAKAQIMETYGDVLNGLAAEQTQRIEAVR